MTQAGLRIAVGQTVKAGRLKRGHSQRTFAAKVGMQRTYMTKVENGLIMPSTWNLARFAEGLDTSLTNLLRNAEKRVKFTRLACEPKDLVGQQREAAGK